MMSYLSVVKMLHCYVLAAAVLEVTAFEAGREEMRDLRRRSSDKLHWNEMDDQEKRTATKTVSELDGFHIVTIGARVPAKKQEQAPGPAPEHAGRQCPSGSS